MRKADDYHLTIEEVARRLEKSVRTIHRYKDSGRLSHVIGQSQGNPLYFSRSEVEQLARELYPHLAAAASPDPAFWQRLERVERLLGVLEANPLLERLLTTSGATLGPTERQDLEQTIATLAGSAGSPGALSQQEVGGLLVKLGQAMMQAPEPTK